MSINDIIVTALEPTGLRVEPDLHEMMKMRGIAFNYRSYGDDYGDDQPNHEKYLVQVHLFANDGQNVVRMRKRIKQLLFSAGFTWPTVVDASDEAGQHWVHECEIALGVDTDGGI